MIYSECNRNAVGEIMCLHVIYDKFFGGKNMLSNPMADFQTLFGCRYKNMSGFWCSTSYTMISCDS